MDEMSSVKLVVKASNQQYDDQTIECELNWNVKKLKEHLFDVYPSKPKPEDQKLIYSGQLLKDKLILKDILRHYEGVQSQTHTFHLVCAPKQRFQIPFGSFPSSQQRSGINQQQNMFTNDGVRQRNNIQRTATTTGSGLTSSLNTTITSASTNSGSATQNNTSVPMMNNNMNFPTSSSSASVSGSNVPPQIFNPIGYQPFVQPVSNDYILAQHVAMQNWMQQAYIQYMNQYMNLLSTGIPPESFFMQNQGLTSIPTPMNNISQSPTAQASLQTTFPFTNIGFNLAATAGSTTINSPSSQNSTQTECDPVIVAESAAAATAVPVPQHTIPASPESQQQPQQQQQQLQQQEQQQPQPRFPNIMQDDVQENRDWLDVFYSISRLMVLLTLVYLYSSPVRCLLVFVIGMAIYLYHMTYFRVQRRQQDDNNNRQAAVQQNGDQQRQQQQQQQQQQQPQEIQQQINENNDVPDSSNSRTQQQETTEQENSNDETATVAGQQTASANNGDTVSTAQTAVSNNVADADADGTSMIAFLKTFVVSFIVSLLPETPPV